MKKTFGILKYNLDNVYFFNEYNKAFSYGQQNKRVSGVNNQLINLKQEKDLYCDKVANIVNPEREINEIKYQKYEKPAILEKKIMLIEIVLIVIVIIRGFIFDFLPMNIQSSIFLALFDLLLIIFSVFIGPSAFIITKIIKHIYGILYKRYVKSIISKLESLGNHFAQICYNYYKIIDKLYLNSLDNTQRELVLLRRQQQEQLQLERERQEIEAERLDEQRRTRAATEELLAIERERENRRRGW